MKVNNNNNNYYYCEWWIAPPRFSRSAAPAPQRKVAWYRSSWEETSFRGGDNNKQWTQATASWGWTEESVVRSSVSGLRRPRCHIHLLEDGIADLQVSWGGRSHRQHTSTLIWKVWLFIVAASSIFDDCNFVVAGVTRRHSTLNRRLTRDLLVTPLHSGVTRCRLLFASHRREYSIK